MRKIDTIEIQKHVEEKRLIIGDKFAAFLMKKLAAFFGFFADLLAAKNCAFFGSLLIIAASLLAQSNRDIGHDSATYVEIAQKMLLGGKYFSDFFELNFPLSFWVTLIPVSIAKIFNFSPIIATEIFVNLVGILSIYCSYHIAQRSLSHKVLNLLILSLSAAFFWRVFTLQFNELATKSSYFLALAFPYICYHFSPNSALKKIDQIIIGSLAALIFALKPNYGILVVVFEFHQLLKNRKISSSFTLRNYITLLILLIYAALITVFNPQYFDNFSLISSAYFQAAVSSLPLIIKEDIFPLLLFAFLTSFIARQHHFLRILQLVFFAACLIVMSEMIGGYDQRFILFSLALPLVVLNLYFLIHENYFDFRRHGIWLIFLFLLPQFDAKNIFALSRDIPAFWFVFVLVFAAKKLHLSHNFRDFRNIFLPGNFGHWIAFTILALALITFSFYAEFAFLSWVATALLFISQLGFYQKIHQHKFNSKRFSLLSAAALTLVLSHLIALHIAAIFNLKFHENAFYYKSPNHMNSQMIETAKTYAPAAQDQVIIISQIIPGAYPAFNYMGKINPLPQLQMPLFYKKISEQNLKDESAFKYLFLRLEQQMNNPQNKLIFVEIKNDLDAGLCQISFLEYYMRDREFRDVFFKNYRFLNRIIEVRGGENAVEFFYNGTNLKPEIDNKIKRDVEVYVRR